MKRVTVNSILASALLFIAADASAAGYKNADKTGASIAEFRDEVLTIKKEVDATLVALDKVVATATTDPRKAFKEFDSAVPRIDDAAKKAKKRADDMRARGADYFKQWEKELATVSNPEIRQLAEERKAKLQGSFGSIKTFMEPARDQFNALQADLKDLQKYLGNDLAIGGIDAAKNLIAKTKTEGQSVVQSLDKVIAELNTVVATLTPAKVKK
jgi:translation initiation factor 2 beta subunit (eIF-2beta)/eIF-5